MERLSHLYEHCKFSNRDFCSCAKYGKYLDTTWTKINCGGECCRQNLCGEQSCEDQDCCGPIIQNIPKGFQEDVGIHEEVGNLVITLDRVYICKTDEWVLPPLKSVRNITCDIGQMEADGEEVEFICFGTCSSSDPFVKLGEPMQAADLVGLILEGSNQWDTIEQVVYNFVLPALAPETQALARETDAELINTARAISLHTEVAANIINSVAVSLCTNFNMLLWDLYEDAAS